LATAMSSLCLSCCSNLSSKSEPQYTTKCCNRHVCDACLAANPRLSHYHPCLLCVGGIQVASGYRSLPAEYTSPRVEQRKREENAFVIGDDEEDDEKNTTGPVADKEATREIVVGSGESLELQRTSEQASPPTLPATKPKYWIQKRDTLQGIALRLGINVCHDFSPLYSSEINHPLQAWALCQLNSLPPSTLSTTPHLLHTRSFLLLPPGTHTPESLNVEVDNRKKPTGVE